MWSDSAQRADGQNEGGHGEHGAGEKGRAWQMHGRLWADEMAEQPRAHGRPDDACDTGQAGQ